MLIHMPFLLGFYKQLAIHMELWLMYWDTLITSDNYISILLMQLMIMY